MYKKSVLDNGIRLVTEYIPDVRSVSVGIWVSVGARDEDLSLNGISHFVEHMLFKGTKKRTAKDIAIEIDSIGGEMNAFTSKEGTTYYAKVLDEHLPVAVDLLSDIFHNSVIDELELDRERKVIAEEIKMVEDTPDDFVHELFVATVWKGAPLGNPILGTRRSLGRIDRENMLGYIRSHYVPSDVVISIAGHFSRDGLLDLLNEKFGRRKGISLKKPGPDPVFRPNVNVRTKDLEQEHICLGYKGVAYVDNNRYGMYALNSLLGSSMSSRLFQEVREKRGLAYSVYSYLSMLRDTGLFTVYAGVSPAKTQRLIRLVRKEITKLAKYGVLVDELTKVKEQMKGSIVLGLENTSNRMSQLAKHEIYLGRYYTVDEVLAEVDKVTKDQLDSMANDIFSGGGYAITALGPVGPAAIKEALN